MNQARSAEPATQVPPVRQIRISILHVPDCPLVGRLRADVEKSLQRTGTMAVIEEIEGPYRSPTLLIDGIEIDGYPMGTDPACRIDLPSEAEITSAIARHLGLTAGGGAQ